MAKKWIDETGLEIPANRITRSEKLRETATERLLKKAQRINESLTAFKTEVADAADEIMELVYAENGLPRSEHKGNFTFFNFDRSIKIEVSIQDRIDFDDALIAVAKQHFDEFLQNAGTGLDEMIRNLVMDAFSTRRGKLDTKKVLSMVSHRTRVPEAKYPKFHQAIDAIERAIRRPDSKRYFRIWKRDPLFGTYDAVELNFSNI